jgi:hypothetical protein
MIEFAEIEQAIHGQQLAPCPLCGSRVGMWQVTHGSGAVQKAAMCSHGEAEDPLGLITSCPMSLPEPGFFYEPTYREAAKVWNDFAAACEARRSTAAARDVLAERQRQISAEGWTPEHDDEHGHGEIAMAAAAYAVASTQRLNPKALPSNIFALTGWSSQWWKPHSPRRDLVKAGALILAEIERLDRAAAPKDTA